MRWLEKGSPLRETVKRGVAETARLMGTITHVATDDPAVALTFDDGPHPEATPRLLDLLGESGARATFFVVGLAARRHRRIVERALAEGHAVANHSWDHPSMPLLTRRAQRLQIEWCRKVLPAGASRLFRPPWGHQDLRARWTARRCGHDVVAWSVMAEDWSDDDAETLLGRIRPGLGPGSIVLFHDALFRTDAPGHRDRRPTVEAVRRLLAEEAGRTRFVTVPELLTLGRARRWHWYKPADLDWLERQI